MLYIVPHHSGHAADHYILPQIIHHLRVHRFVDLGTRLVESPDVFNHRRVDAQRPQELLEVQGVHGHSLNVADGERRHLAIPDAQQRSGSDDVIPTIDGQELQRGSGVRTALNLIKKQQGFAGDETAAGNREHDARHDAVHVIIALEDISIRTVFLKVQSNDMLIVLFAEFLNDIRLTYLTRPLQQQTLSLFPGFPSNQLIHNLALQHEAPPFHHFQYTVMQKSPGRKLHQCKKVPGLFGIPCKKVPGLSCIHFRIALSC